MGSCTYTTPTDGSRTHAAAAAGRKLSIDVSSWRAGPVGHYVTYGTNTIRSTLKWHELSLCLFCMSSAPCRRLWPRSRPCSPGTPPSDEDGSRFCAQHPHALSLLLSSARISNHRLDNYLHKHRISLIYSDHRQQGKHLAPRTSVTGRAGSNRANSSASGRFPTNPLSIGSSSPKD